MLKNPFSSQKCEDECDVEKEFILDFKIVELTLAERPTEDVFILMSFDKNVYTIPMKGDEESYKAEKSQVFKYICTPNQLYDKLMTIPIMFSISAGLKDLGIIRYKMSECFASAVKCPTFQSQRDMKKLELKADGKELGILTLTFTLMTKLEADNKIFIENFLKEKEKHALKLKKQRREEKKRMKDQLLKEMASDQEDDSTEDESSEQSSDQEIKILDQEALKDLNLEQDPSTNMYRIYNGNLINIKDKMGPCGKTECQAATKIDTTMSKNSKLHKKPSKPNITTKCVKTPKCSKSYSSPESDDKMKNKNSSKRKQKNPYTFHCSNPLVDYTKNMNAEEEKLFKKLCKEFGLLPDTGTKNNKTRVRKTESGAVIPSSVVGRNVDDYKTARKKIKSVLEPEIDPCRPSEKIRKEKRKFIEMVKRKTRGKFSYSFGKTRPIVQHIHQECQKPEIDLVPKNMGWQWNDSVTGVDKKRPNWRPGKVSYAVRKLMKHFLNPYPYDTIPITKRDETGKVVGADEELIECKVDPRFIEQLPTLGIQKKDGEYFIKMHPLKDSEQLGSSCNPYLNSSPIVFKVRKSPEAIKRHKAKKILRLKGFEKKCPCQTFKECRCMDENAKKLMETEMESISRKYCLADPLKPCDLLVESSDSEFEMEFTTPSAVVRNPTKCKPDAVAVETQYDVDDLMIINDKRVTTSNAADKKQKLTKKTTKKADTKDTKKNAKVCC